MSTFLRSLAPRRGLLLVATAHFIVAAILCMNLSVWRDEGYSLATTSHDPLTAWGLGISFELQAPLYFFLLSLWRTIDEGYFFARLFSAFATTGTLFFADSMARRHFPRLNSLWLTGAIALHPLTLWAGSEIRVYALALFLATGILWSFSRAFLEGQFSVRRVLPFIAFGILGLYTQYFCAFVLLSCALSLLITKRFRAFGWCVASGLVITVIFIPLLLAMMDQLTEGPPPELLSLKKSMSFSGRRIERLMLPLNECLSTGVRGTPLRILRWCGRLGLLALVGFTLHQSGGIKQLRSSSFLAANWIAALICVFFFVAAGAVLGHHLVGPERYWVLFTVPLLMAPFGLLALHPSRFTVPFWLLWVLIPSLVVDLDRFSKPKQGNTLAAALVMLEARQSEEPVFAFPSDNSLALRAHLGSPVEGLPTNPPLDIFDYRQFVIDGKGELLKRFSTLPEKGSFWVMVEPIESHRGFDYGLSTLNNYLTHDVEKIERYDLEGVTLHHVRRKGDEAQ